MEGLCILENYLIRRVLGNEKSNYLNKMFPSLWNDVTTHDFVASLKRALARRNYPSDVRIRQGFANAALYGRGRQERLLLVFDSINRQLSQGSGGHTVLDDEPTVEHIMPQTLTDEWKQMLGPECERVHGEYLNAPGNLTLVTRGWNSSLSNAPFARKRQEYARHALRLNADYFGGPDAPAVWDEAALQARTVWLAERTIEVWPSCAPSLSTQTEDAPSTRRAKPKALIIMNDFHDLRSWRDAARVMTQIVIDTGAEAFTQLTEASSLLTRDARERAEELPNGWYLSVSIHAATAERYCQQAADALGLADDEWEIVYDER